VEGERVVTHCFIERRFDSTKVEIAYRIADFEEGGTHDFLMVSSLARFDEVPPAELME
jgi:hypothetical protein